MQDGEIDILIGTHALFQADVAFKDLAFAVIDEQHRFGVHQRLALQAKGGNGGTNVLVMTATPIPRTLLMTHYGDLDVSKLTEKPAGRKPIVTKTMPLELLERLIERLRVQLSEGAQVYWVCPLIESSERPSSPPPRSGTRICARSSAMTSACCTAACADKAKDATMAAFAAGQLKILVATTVIEVGVDVPNANIMVIEHAERFGLAQLHQLRGRVGRGTRESFCMLLYKAPLGETARPAPGDDGTDRGRLPDRREGPRAARRRRGAGRAPERCAGVPRRRGAGLRGAAGGGPRRRGASCSRTTRTSSRPAGEALRTLLYLFECDEAVRLFRAA